MKKNLLLITAFLAIAGTAMAVTPAEIGKEARESTIEYRLGLLKEVKMPKWEDGKYKVDGVLEEATFTEVTAEIAKISPNQDNELIKNTLERVVRELNTKIDEAIKNPGNKKVEDLKEFKAKLEEAIKYNNEKIDVIDKVVKNGAELMDSRIEMINPNSDVTDLIYEKEFNLRTRLFDIEDTADILTKHLDVSKDRGWLNGYVEVKKELGDKDSGAVKDYEDAKKAFEDAKKAFEDAEPAEKDGKKADLDVKKGELKLAEKDLEKAKENFRDVKKAINSILSIAGTDVDKLLSLKGDALEKEKKVISEKLVAWKEEKEAYMNVASIYVYGMVGPIFEDGDNPKDRTEKLNYTVQSVAARVTENAINIENNKKAIARNAQDIKDLRKDHNRGMAQMAAMASVDFGNVKARTVKVGAGIGQHSSETAVAVGVAVTPTDALMVNAKWSTSANSIKKSTLGLGATYEFNF